MMDWMNLLARGAGSLSFEKRRTILKFNDKPLLVSLKKNPRTPEEIMQLAWEDVGSNMQKVIKGTNE
jgi:hypothetical protein